MTRETEFSYKSFSGFPKSMAEGERDASLRNSAASERRRKERVRGNMRRRVFGGFKDRRWIFRDRPRIEIARDSPVLGEENGALGIVS